MMENEKARATATQSSANAHQNLLFERQGQIATFTFNRPRVRNAINTAMWHQLQRQMAEIADDPEIRVLLFRGAGDQAFSAGADISEFGRTRSTPEGAREAFNVNEQTLQQIEALPQATIAVIKGYAVGAGCELANACDLRIAAHESKIGIPAGKRGITIGHGHIRRLVRLVGPARAKDLLFTGRLLDGERALRVGLVDYTTPLAELDHVVERVVDQIAGHGPLTVQWAKRAIQRVLDDPALSGLEDDAAESIGYHATGEFAEGVRAFKEKREPRFRG